MLSRGAKFETWCRCSLAGKPRAFWKILREEGFPFEEKLLTMRTRQERRRWSEQGVVHEGKMDGADSEKESFVSRERVE